MSGIVRSDLKSLAEAFDQAALRFRTARLRHATISGINPAYRHGHPSEKARALLACAPTRGRHPIDYATVQVGREGVEPFGLSVFFSPTDAGALAFEEFQTLAAHAYRKAAVLSGSDVPYWGFPAPEREPLPHLWAIGVERWALAELSGIVCAEDVAVHPDGNTLSIGERGEISLGTSLSGLADEVAYIARNVDRIVRLEDDWFSASASAMRWLMEHRKPKKKQRKPGIPTDLITQVQAADDLGCSERTIQRRIDDGTVRGYGPKGKRKVSQGEVEAKASQILERQPRKKKRTLN